MFFISRTRLEKLQDRFGGWERNSKHKFTIERLRFTLTLDFVMRS